MSPVNILRVLLKTTAQALLPHNAFMAIKRWRHRHEPPLEKRRRDLTVFPVQEHVEVRVYWASRYNGTGPAMNVSVFDEEVLRFDCFGEIDGHYHVKTGREETVKFTRLRFREQTIDEQIARSLFEVRSHLPYHLERHKDRRIRAVKVDQARLESVLQSIEKKMAADAEASAAYDGPTF